MKRKQLFELLDNSIDPEGIRARIGMILSNRIDYGSEDGGMISVKQFDILTEDLIEYFNLR